MTNQTNNTENKILEIARQKEASDQEAGAMLGMSIFLMGAMVCIGTYGITVYETGCVRWQEIMMFSFCGLVMLLGIATMFITKCARPYKCETCGHIHVAANILEMIGFAFGKKNLHCTLCNKKTLHTKVTKKK